MNADVDRLIQNDTLTSLDTISDFAKGTTPE